MKESADFMDETPIHIVDIRIKDLATFILGYDIIVGNSSWNECCPALPQQDFITRTPYADCTVSFYTHGDDETVVLS